MALQAAGGHSRVTDASSSTPRRRLATCSPTARRWALRGLIALAFLTLPVGAAVAQDPASDRLLVLGPEAGRRVEAALNGAAAGWVARDVRVQPERIVVTACRTDAPDTCLDAVLERALAACPGIAAGPFCATGAALDPSLSVALARGLGSLGADDVWERPKGAHQVAGFAGLPPAERRPEGVARSCSRATLLGLLLALLVAPFLAGWLAARGLRRYAPSLGAAWRRGLVTLWGGLLAVLLFLAGFGAWDVAWVVGLAGLGTLAGRLGRVGTLRFMAVLLGVVVAFGAAEVAARFLGGPAPDLPPAACARLLAPRALFSTAPRDSACGAHLPRERPQRLVDQERGGARDARSVLHLGDSMIAAFAVPEDATVTAHLGRLSPDVRQFDASWPGTALDHHARVALDWTARRRFERVVVYLYGGNDLTDLGAPTECCGGGPWLDLDDAGAVRPCEPVAPSRWTNAAEALSEAPLPYVLRAATAVSRIAGRMVEAWAHRGWTPPRSDVNLARTVRLIRWLDAELAARQSALAIVLVPSPAAWHGRASEEEKAFRAAVAQAAAGGSIPLLDLLPELQQASSWPTGEGPYDTVDGHFGPTGHLAVANAVARFLRTLDEGSVEPRSPAAE